MKATTTESGSARDIDDYLAAVPDEARAALENLRKAIRAAAPAGTEAINGFGSPMFSHNGLPLVTYWAAKSHCSLYVMKPKLVEAHAEDLKGYDASGATIRFPANKPLPAALVEKLIKAGIAESEARATKTKPTKRQTKE